jgi:SAM-dependent methyltransferase
MSRAVDWYHARGVNTSLQAIVVVAVASCGQPSTPRSANPDMFSEADAYERFMGRWSRLVAPSLVELAGVRDGEAVLDVGSGTGALSLAVRDATATARITGIDPSRAYVDHAQRATADGRVRFEVGDAQRMRFADATFDRTVSLLVLNFIPDRDRALREMIRVTRPGGTITAAVWDYADGMEMLRVFWDEASRMDPSVRARDEANMPLCKRGELGVLWRSAGLRDVVEDALVVTLHFASFDDFWEPFLLGQGPAGAYVAQLPPERRVELADRLRARLPGGPFELRARAWAVRGTVP